jgi:hypothetical protein
MISIQTWMDCRDEDGRKLIQFEITVDVNQLLLDDP